tara:strand:- start:7692 stop:8462 length:771 start_codon:yes stop_codon:yes gene_type:complete
MELQNQIAIVTGGNSGLGAGCVKLLKDNNIKVAIIDQNIESHESTTSRENELAIKCDITQTSEIEEAINRIHEHFGALPRICINCAGIAPAKRILGKEGPMPLENFQKVIDVNLIGTFNIMRLCAEKMSMLDPINDAGERGVIINTASIAAFEGQIGQAAYSASKGGIVSMTLPAARELARFGIRVNAIAPGIFATPILLNMSQEITDNLIKSTPFPKRLGKPEEFAKLAIHIIENTMINGAVLRLDGGVRLEYEK